MFGLFIHSAYNSKLKELNTVAGKDVLQWTTRPVKLLTGELNG